MTKKEWRQYIITIVISLALLLFAYHYVQTRMASNFVQADFVAMKARVTEITDDEKNSYDTAYGVTITDRTITFDAELLNEYRRGSTITTTQAFDGYISYNIKPVEVGDLVMIYEYHDDTGYRYVFGDYWRSTYVLWLAILFVIAVLTFGRLKGLNTLLGLGVTCMFVFMVFIPSILAGCNIYLWSILTCLYSIVTTLLIVNGYNHKSYIAAAGCFGGVMIAGILTAVMNKLMHITGLVDEQAMYLNDLSSGLTVDLRAIVFAAIIIGATGAVMDVSISIASSLNELNDQLEHPTFRQLLRSGFTIGRDMMGTMANTLVLAYIGSSLATVVLIVAYNSSLLSIFNKELIVTDIEQAIIGSLGILSAIPLTSLLASWFYPMSRSRNIPEATTTADASGEATALTDVKEAQTSPAVKAAKTRTKAGRASHIAEETSDAVGASNEPEDPSIYEEQ